MAVMFRNCIELPCYANILVSGGLIPSRFSRSSTAGEPATRPPNYLGLGLYSSADPEAEDVTHQAESIFSIVLLRKYLTKSSILNMMGI
jgi:hypothetical protein